MREEIPKMIGKCGYYCGSCPTYLEGSCQGCMEEHKAGDCYTRDCVLRQNLNFCGECHQFPCDVILTQDKTSVLDKSWLLWKKYSKDQK